MKSVNVTKTYADTRDL